MTLKALWQSRHQTKLYRRNSFTSLVSEKGPIEWDWNGATHIFAMTHPSDWACWCTVKPGKAYREEFPIRGLPAEEATLAPFRLDRITCIACRFMWEMIRARWRMNQFEFSFLWMIDGCEYGSSIT